MCGMYQNMQQCTINTLLEAPGNKRRRGEQRAGFEGDFTSSSGCLRKEGLDVAEDIGSFRSHPYRPG